MCMRVLSECAGDGIRGLQCVCVGPKACETADSQASGALLCHPQSEGTLNDPLQCSVMTDLT